MISAIFALFLLADFTGFTYCHENSRGPYELQCLQFDQNAKGEVKFKRREAETVTVPIQLSDPARVGTMLTLQTALGFTLTLITIHLMPYLVDALSWRYAFAPLAIGPALGIWAMARLRLHPQSVRLAGGRR